MKSIFLVRTVVPWLKALIREYTFKSPDYIYMLQNYMLLYSYFAGGPGEDQARAPKVPAIRGTGQFLQKGQRRRF